MYTHCPHCETYFRVTSEQLKLAQGDVRCGRCYGTFNALESLVDEPPKTKPTPAPSTLSSPSLDNASSVAEATVVQVDETILASQDDVEALADAKPKPKGLGDQTLKHQHRKEQIEEIQASPSESSSSGRHILMLLASGVLLLILATQYAYFNLKALSQNADLRPALSLMCKALNCQLDLQRAPHMIRLVERDIRAHKSKKDVLVVNAVMINDAAFQQAFPAMQLSMQDITGHIMSGRRFVAEEYLTDSTLDISKGIAPRQAIKVQLELIDPGKEAVGFEFEFF